MSFRSSLVKYWRELQDFRHEILYGEADDTTLRDDGEADDRGADDTTRCDDRDADDIAER